MDPRLQRLLLLPRYVRALILVAIIGIVAAGFFFGLYKPQLEKHDRLVKQGEKLERTLAEKREIADNLERYRAEYEALEAQLEQSLKELPKKKEIPTLLTSIAALAKKQGLEVLLFKPQKERNKEFYAEVPVQIELAGDYHQVAMFYEAVGKLDRIVNIGNLNLSRKKSKDDEGRLLIKCQATTYRFVNQPPKSNAKNKKKRRR